MKRKSTALLFVLFLLLSGCVHPGKSSDKESPDVVHQYIGYVVKHKPDQLLVTAFSANTSQSEAIWVRTKKQYGLGTKVAVEFNGEIETSYPGQAAVKSIEMIKADSPQGADITAEDIVARALNHFNSSIPIVKAVEYLSNEKLWHVTLFDDAQSNHSEHVLVFTQDGKLNK
ncbi:DUF3221 domain-containing protein [Paenibacillus terrigena]|uniref:DUF3221 domain-containing protein n=1 Tax=Paenibacillus terrigena TaxID=369333 RepID=UPI00037CF3E4|nr:DUF3221 domain-containing protein [Paenibacillus terrigena]